jgi:hypothetical protein
LRLWDTTAKYHPKVEWSLDEHFDPNLPFRKRLTGLKCAKIYSGHVNTKFCTFAAFCVASPKRQLIACGSEDGNVYLYGLHSRAIEQVLQGHKRTPNNAAALHALSPQLGPDTSVTTSPPIHPSADSASPSTSTAEFHDVTLPSSATIGGAPISNSSSLALAVAAHPTREILATSGRIHDGALSVWVPASHTDTQDAEGKTTSMESTSSPNKRVCIHSLQTP